MEAPLVEPTNARRSKRLQSSDQVGGPCGYFVPSNLAIHQFEFFIIRTFLRDFWVAFGHDGPCLKFLTSVHA